MSELLRTLIKERNELKVKIENKLKEFDETNNKINVLLKELKPKN